MVSKEFFNALEQLEQEKKIKKEDLIASLETALTTAYKRQYNTAFSAAVRINPEKHTIRVYSYRTVVEEVNDPDKEISLQDAKLLKKSLKLGDTIEKEEAPKEFGRVAIQTAKQVIMQRLREAEKENTIKELAEKEEKLITAVVRRTEGLNVFVEIAGTMIEALMNDKDQLPGEKYVQGQRIKVFVKKVKEGMHGPLVQVSRSCPEFVEKLMELEIPEIANGEVEIKAIAREAGLRTKVAVFAPNPNVDAIGACLGNKSMRINTIISEINGEKIDLMEYSDDIETFVLRALSPAQVTGISVGEDNKILAVVPDDKLSLAIGKKGHNVRLAAKLTGAKIDVKSQSEIDKLEEDKQVEVGSEYEYSNDLDNFFDDDDNE